MPISMQKWKDTVMFSATNPSRRPNFRCLLGLCLAGALSGCAMESAEGKEEASSQVSEALYDPTWTDLGKPTDFRGVSLDTDDLAVANRSSTESEIYVIAADHRVWTRAASTVWLSLGAPSGVNLAGVAACWRGGTKTDVVATDSAGTIWSRTRSSTGSWGTWATVGASPGQAVGKPGASCVSGNDRLDVWVRGTDNALWHAYRFGTQAWSNWINEGAPSGGLNGPPSAFTRSAVPLTIDIAARGTGHNTWHRAYLNGWYAWENAGGMQVDSNPCMGVDVGSKPLIMAQDPSDNSTMTFWEHENGVWHHVPGYFGLPVTGSHGDPVFIQNSGPSFFSNVYVRGSTDNVWQD